MHDDNGQTGGIVALPEQIELHARGVSQLGERIGQTAQAAGLMALDRAAYGQMCAFLPHSLSPLQERISQVIQHVANSLTATNEALTSAAVGYALMDKLAAADLDATGAEGRRRP